MKTNVSELLIILLLAAIIAMLGHVSYVALRLDTEMARQEMENGKERQETD